MEGESSVSLTRTCPTTGGWGCNPSCDRLEKTDPIAECDASDTTEGKMGRGGEKGDLHLQRILVKSYL